MNPLLKEIRHNPLLWLLAFVPVVFAAQKLKPEAHTLLFVLSVLAIVPLAALLSHATESVAAKTGDTVGGLLNATLGNLTELVIALAALRAGQYTLVKASIAGAIVTNTLFMLGASFLLGGLKHHVQEYNRGSARLQAGLLFLATIAMLIPSAVYEADSAAGSEFTEKLSVSLSVLLIATYGLGLLFSLKTHRDFFGSAEHAETGDAPWPLGLALAHAGRRHGTGRAGERGVRRVGAAGGGGVRDDSRVRGFHRRGASGRCGGDGLGVFRRAREQAGPERGHRAGERIPNRALRRSGAGTAQLRDRPGADEPTVLAGRGGNDAHRHHDRVLGDQQRALGVVCRSAGTDGVPDFRHDGLPVAAPVTVTGPPLETQRSACCVNFSCTAVSVCNIAIHAMVMVAVIRVA
jgi:Ca2+/H+ antiporter